MIKNTEPGKNVNDTQPRGILSSLRKTMGRPSALVLLAIAVNLSGCKESDQCFTKRAILTDDAGRHYTVYAIRSYERKSLDVYGCNRSYIHAFGVAATGSSAVTFCKIDLVFADEENPLKQYACLEKLEEVYNQAISGQLPQEEPTEKDEH